MYCPECQAEISQNPKFCSNCGYHLNPGANSKPASIPKKKKRGRFVLVTLSILVILGMCSCIFIVGIVGASFPTYYITGYHHWGNNDVDVYIYTADGSASIETADDFTAGVVTAVDKEDDGSKRIFIDTNSCRYILNDTSGDLWKVPTNWCSGWSTTVSYKLF